MRIRGKKKRQMYGFAGHLAMKEGDVGPTCSASPRALPTVFSWPHQLIIKLRWPKGGSFILLSLGRKKMAKQLRMAETEELTRARSPKGEHRFHGWDEVQRSEAPPGMSHHEDDDHRGKRSVVARVKDKARKLKNSFRRKKHGGNEDNASPARGSSLSEEEEEEEEEEDPEYHGAPMYESATIPRLLAGTQSPETPHNSTTASPITTPKEPLAVEQSGKKSPNASKNQHTEFLGEPPELPAAPEADPSDDRTLAQNVKEILTPAYNMITSATQVIGSKIHGNLESTDSASANWDESGAKQSCDKDVSVKKYLMAKLQPGDDERALSQVITEAITPGPAGNGDGGGAGQAVVSAVEKFKGAVSSLVGMADITDDSPPAREVVPPAKIQGDHSGEEIPVSTIPFPRKTFS
ncbi:hypothetical protein KSP40_PGU017919 [Platanthera guangdongensis]|uniref:Uncharacterized protein n=1 Tax=Platanthera guangdongensis TaxID=2320717 RepID=A0ABR2LT81_9ASPA